MQAHVSSKFQYEIELSFSANFDTSCFFFFHIFQVAFEKAVVCLYGTQPLPCWTEILPCFFFLDDW